MTTRGVAGVWRDQPGRGLCKGTPFLHLWMDELTAAGDTHITKLHTPHVCQPRSDPVMYCTMKSCTSCQLTSPSEDLLTYLGT